MFALGSFLFSPRSGFGRLPAGLRAGRWRLAGFLPGREADLGQDRILYQQCIHGFVNGADLIDHMVVEQPQQDHPDIDVRIELAARILVRIADRLWCEGIVVRLQAGVADQHANPLVEGDEFLVAILAQSGCQGIELDRLVQVFFAHQFQL